VLEDTATQLRQAAWIALVEEHGFQFVTGWHPSPEYKICDAYLFVRLP